MRLHVNASAFGGNRPALYADVHVLFAKTSDDPDARLVLNGMDVIADGSTDPGAVVAIAESWNDDIIKELHAVVRSFLDGCPEPDSGKVGSSHAYALAKAAMAASDMFYHFGPRAVHVQPDEKYLGVALSKGQLDFVRQHPADFVVIDAIVK